MGEHIAIYDRVWTEHGTGTIHAISTSGGHHTAVDVRLDEHGNHHARWICLPITAVTPLPAGNLPNYPAT